MTDFTPYYLPQFFSTTLSTVGGIDDSQTTGIKITSVSGLDITKAGIVCLSYADPLDTSKAEWVSYTSIDGTNELQGVTRGADGYAAKTHSNGVTAAFPLSKSNLNEVLDALTGEKTGVTLASPTIQAYDGWIDADETWAYASATTITVPSGAASKYAKGDKIKLTQTTVKYFYVVSVADTVLTVTGGSDYTVANAAITANYYSHGSSPIGFPDVFNYTLAFSASSGTAPSLGNANVTSVFSLKGQVVTFQVNIIFGSTSSYGDAGAFRFSLPIAHNALYDSVDFAIGTSNLLDNGTTRSSANVNLASGGLALLRIHLSNNDVKYNGPWAWASGDVISFEGTYYI